jgi:hypothetical protein
MRHWQATFVWCALSIAPAATIAHGPLIAGIATKADPEIGYDKMDGGPWKVQVPNGILEIGVDTVGAAGTEEHTLSELKAILADPSDGQPVYAVIAVSSSRTPFPIQWRVVGEGRHPAGPRDLGDFNSRGNPVLTRKFPAGTLRVDTEHAGELTLWAVDDHVIEPCETYRIEFVDARTHKPLIATNGEVVVAHGVIEPRFDPANPAASNRCIPAHFSRKE